MAKASAARKTAGEGATASAPPSAVVVLGDVKAVVWGDQEQLADRVASLVAAGFKMEVVLSKLGVEPEQIAGIVGAADFRDRVRAHRPPPVSHQEVQRMFIEEAAPSVDTLRYERDNAPDSKDRRAAAKALIDYAGHTPIRRVATVHVHLSPMRKKLIEQTVAEAGRALDAAAQVGGDEQLEQQPEEGERVL
jgi:hypothetical protein